MTEAKYCRFVTLRIAHCSHKTNRDAEVVRLVSLGFTAKQIASQGRVSYRLIENVIDNLKKAHNCKNTAHLVATFIRNKIIE